MSKRLTVLAAVLAVGLVPVASAQAATAKPKPRSFSLSFTAAALVPVANTDDGVVTGSLGKGAIVIVGTDTGRVTVYCAGGSLSAKFKLTITPNPDNSASYSGTVTLDTGTGAYKGAKGSGTVSGSIAADGTVTGTAKGKVTY